MSVAKKIEEVLSQALKICGSRTELSRRLKIRLGTVCQWYRGSLPRIHHVEALEKLVKERGHK